MSDIGAMVDLLIAAGTPAGLAAEVVAQAFAAGVVTGGHRVDKTAEKRRAWERLYRLNKRKNPPVIHPIPPDPPVISENASLSKEEDKKEIKEEREATAKPVHPTRGQRLPDEWAPDADDWQAALTAIGPDRSRTELAKFRDHWKQQPGSRGVKLDWAATWRNWIRRAAEYHGGPNGNRPHPAARGSASADFFAGMRSVAADIDGHDPAPGPADPKVPLGRVNIDG